MSPDPEFWSRIEASFLEFSFWDRVWIFRGIPENPGPTLIINYDYAPIDLYFDLLSGGVPVFVIPVPYARHRNFINFIWCKKFHIQRENAEAECELV